MRELTSEKEAYMGKVLRQQFEKEKNIAGIQRGRKVLA